MSTTIVRILFLIIHRSGNSHATRVSTGMRTCSKKEKFMMGISHGDLYILPHGFQTKFCKCGNNLGV